MGLVIISPENEFEGKLIDLCENIANTLIKKNRDYGNSFSKLYDEYGDICVAIRLSDKLERFKTLINKPNEVNESIEDTLKDLAGYAILTLSHRGMK